MTPRQLAEKWRSENPGHDHGYVILFRGEVTGWTHELSNEPREWKRGCMAVPRYRNAPMYISDGNDASSWGGSACWERMDPKYEPV